MKNQLINFGYCLDRVDCFKVIMREIIVHGGKMANNVKRAKSFLILTAAVVFIAAAQDVIQTQDSDTWDGIAADLTQLSVKNDVLTLRLKIRNTGSESPRIEFLYRDCYIIDESNQKKYFLLKDSEGQFISRTEG